MTTSHVSPLTLDALALGALDRDREAEIHAHLAGCAECRGARDAAAALREHFTARVLPRGLPARRPPRWRWLVAPALSAALAVALLVVLWPRALPPAPNDLGIKGTASWQVFANRSGHTFAVHDGTELAAGDRIRFIVVPGGARYLLVASVDGRGAVTIYYPYEGSQSAPIDGERFELTGSIVLDAAPGPERIYALLSDEPITADAVRAPLRVVARGGAVAIRGTYTLPVPVRAQASLVFEKVAP